MFQTVLDEIPDITVKLTDLETSSKDLSRVCNEPNYVEQVNSLQESAQALEAETRARNLELKDAAFRWQKYEDGVQDLARSMAGCKRAILSPEMEKKTLKEQLKIQKVCLVLYCTLKKTFFGSLC